jgi:hypothetical protein
MKLVPKSSPSFMYANGLLMLTVVFIPFPTSLLGEYVLTDHSAPAVILYSSACAFQAIAWFVLFFTALNPNDLLARNEQARLVLHEKQMYSVFSFGLYAICAIAAIWIPQPVAILICLTWIFWLVVSVNLRRRGETVSTA